MKKLLGYFHIVLNLHKMSISDEVVLALTGLNYATDPDYTDPTITQPQLQALATTVQNDLGSRITSASLQLTEQEQIDVDALSRAIITVKSEVEVVANKKAGGNRAVFETIVRRIGLHPSQPQAKHVRIVGFMHSEKGGFHFIVPSEGKDVIYIYEFGFTTAENVLPAEWLPVIPLDLAELIMIGFTSGDIIAMHYAVQKSPPRVKAKTAVAADTAKTDIAKTTKPSGVLTMLPVNNKGKVILTYGATYWHFSNVMYFRIP